jgi:hypothetical protein
MITSAYTVNRDLQQIFLEPRLAADFQFSEFSGYQIPWLFLYQLHMTPWDSYAHGDTIHLAPVLLNIEAYET